MTTKQVGVYIIQNDETHETYVGSGVLSDRKKNHFCDLRNGSHCNKKLQEAYNRSPNFEFIGIPTDDREQAYAAEQTLINEHVGNPLLLNVVLDVNEGVPRGWNHSEETKQRLREQKLGTKASEETRQKMSIAATGNQNGLGYRHSEEAKEKITQALIGHTVKDETREKMRQTQLGRTPHENTLSRIMETRRPVIANGIEYSSVADAARAFGVATNTIQHRLKSANFQNWHFKDC